MAPPDRSGYSPPLPEPVPMELKMRLPHVRKSSCFNAQASLEHPRRRQQSCFSRPCLGLGLLSAGDLGYSFNLSWPKGGFEMARNGLETGTWTN